MTGTRLGSRLAGVASLTCLAALTVGLPILLWRVGGNPLPAHMPGARQITSTLTHRDNGTLFLAAVRDITWIAWLVFTLTVLAETQAVIRGRAAPRLRLGAVQGSASRMIAVAALTFTAPAAIAIAAVPAPSATATVSAHAPTGVAADPAPTLDAGAAATLAAYTAPASQPAQATTWTYTVQPNDCLWTIAATYLGNGNLWPEIAQLNLGHEMSDGTSTVMFTNPSDIWPQWQLIMPGPAPDSVTAQPVTQPAPAQSDPPPPSHEGHAGAHAPFGTPHASAPARHSVSAARPASLPSDASDAAAAGHAHRPGTATAAPAAHHIPDVLELIAVVVVAGGTIEALRRLRHRQRQNRRPGRRIRLPADPQVLAAEQRLATTASGPARLIPLTLRAALAALAEAQLADGQPLPGIAGLHIVPGHTAVDGYLELLLTGLPGTRPPPPWTVTPGRQGMCWQLQLPAAASTPPTTCDPLPGLVSAGVTGQGGHLLIDLEALRWTACTGPADLTWPVLSTMAAELAMSQLAGWYELILAGYPELAAADGRGRACDTLDEALDLLDRRATEAWQRLAAQGAPDDIRLRRAASPDSGWDLTLLVSAIPPDTDQAARLLNLTAVPGIAALTAGPGNLADAPAIIEVSGPPGQIVAHISPLQVTVHPRPLSAGTYEAIVTLFATAADDDDVPADSPPYGAYASQPWLFGGAAGDPPAVTPDPWDAAATSNPAAMPSSAAKDPGPPATAADPRPDPPAGSDRSAGGLRISVLGPVVIDGPAASLEPAQTALILALALADPCGLPAESLRHMTAVDPGYPRPDDQLRQIIGRTRHDLGVASDGSEWIHRRPDGSYVLHAAAELDWTQFHDLAGRGITAGDTHLLAAALALVRGEPFEDSWQWWLPVPLTEVMNAEITDTATRLAELELTAGRPTAAAAAARAGLAGSPAAEQLWRALMRAEAAASPAAVSAAWNDCLAALARHAPGTDPSAETVALYQTLIGGQPGGGKSVLTGAATR
jgi:DNA-binding SARP family transcriptional activator